MKRVLRQGSIILALSAAGLIWYQTAMGDDRQTTADPADGALFFASPRQAVDAIGNMLSERDWASLARYYDLDGADIDRKTLISGEFFVRTERPEVSHPGGFWRYKHPFAPGFEYSFDSGADQDGIVTVRVSIRIDQGSDSPAQQGWREFEMRRSERGLQVLPQTRERAPGPPPSLASPPLPPPAFMRKKSGK